MNIRHLILAMLFAAVLLVTGCADFKTYIKDRGNDLADCFTARAGIGYGLGGRAQLTHYVRMGVGVGSYVGRWDGWLGRDRIDSNSRECLWIGAPFSLLALSTELRVGEPHILTPCILGVDIAGISVDIDPERYAVDPGWRASAPYLRKRMYLEIGATLGAVGFDVGFNPVEFVDFLLGWTTLDITGDDTENFSRAACGTE